MNSKAKKDPKNQPKRVERRDELIALVPAAPKGVTITQITKQLKVPHQVANLAIRDVRLFFGDDAEINLVATPQGFGEEWLYQWSTGEDGVAPWLEIQGKNIDSRLETNLAMAITDVRRFKGQTSKEAKAARLKAKVYARLVEDLAEIMADA